MYIYIIVKSPGIRTFSIPTKSAEGAKAESWWKSVKLPTTSKGFTYVHNIALSFTAIRKQVLGTHGYSFGLRMNLNEYKILLRTPRRALMQKKACYFRGNVEQNYTPQEFHSAAERLKIIQQNKECVKIVTDV